MTAAHAGALFLVRLVSHSSIRHIVSHYGELITQSYRLFQYIITPNSAYRCSLSSRTHNNHNDVYYECWQLKNQGGLMNSSIGSDGRDRCHTYMSLEY